MPRTTLSLPQRRTVATASRLIFDAGYREKARLLDDMLERSTIFIDPDTPPDRAQATDRQIHVGARLKLSDGHPEAPLDRTSDDFLAVAALLVLLADQALGHTRLEALGDTVAFCQALQRRVGDLYGTDTDANRTRVTGRSRSLEEWAHRLREEEAKKAPPARPPVHKSPIRIEFKVFLPEPGVEFTERAVAIGVRADHPEFPPAADGPAEVNRAD
jgi:hypothetical protein